MILLIFFTATIVSFAQGYPLKATFDPSRKAGKTVEILSKAFTGSVKVYPQGKTPPKLPKEHSTLVRLSDRMNDVLWVKGDSNSWAHLSFWEREPHLSRKADPIVQAGIGAKDTKYKLCEFTDVGSGVVAWGIRSQISNMCKPFVVRRKSKKADKSGSSLASQPKEKAIFKDTRFANGVTSDPDQIQIFPSEEVSLIYIHDLNGDIAVDVLVGSVGISTVTSSPSVSAGNRYTYPRSGVEPKLEKIDPTEVSKSPSLNAFLDKENWSSDVAPLIDKLNSALSTSAPQLTKEQQEILDAHNRWRSQVKVPPLRWSKKLADYAQEWADNPKAQEGPIELEHRSGGASGAGENMAGGSSVTEMVDRWGSEGENYDYATNSCRPGKVCGHYTQVVWRNSTDLGCGVAPHRSYGKLLVCNYSPPGNYRGQRPY
ncbi:MAG: pathogenesis-related family 1 protein [Chlorogloeopsis fritschii C42_A2020_084]|uniref:pathogenesis-related family 1 protein n=1 Tax=Chlorogloeopsis fritschii TaxID=1124 RepID=UPI0019F0A5E0|nr:pathogenesis-related family 1 protein [Chlorogloeopsis fritschii]MBF2008077.1 pathogenesis-related family 1 protein [Chlorogloeopsis fritschii C42_A2020_084]